MILYMEFRGSTFAFDEAEEEQQHHRSDKRAHQRPQKVVGGNAEEAENESAQHRANHPHDEVAEEAETVAFDHGARQKSGGDANENKPEPVHVNHAVSLVSILHDLPSESSTGSAIPPKKATTLPGGRKRDVDFLVTDEHRSERP